MVLILGKELRPLFQRNGGEASINLQVIETICCSRVSSFDMRNIECSPKTESDGRVGAPWNQSQITDVSAKTRLSDALCKVRAGNIISFPFSMPIFPTSIRES